MNSSKPKQIQKLFVPKTNNNKYKNNVPPLISCVFHPFDGPLHKLDSLPDGDNSNRLLIDHSTYTDFTINAGGTITLRVLPTLPFCALYQPVAGTSYTATDPVFGSNTNIFGTDTDNPWMPCNSINQYGSILTPNNVYSTVTPPYSQTSYRIISSAWRIIYTGTVANGSGIVTCRDLPIHVDNYAAAGTGGIRYPNVANSGSIATTGPVSVAIVDFPTGAGGLDVGKSVFTRLDHNPWGIVKRNNRLYTWQTFYEQPFLLLPSSYSIAQMQAASTTPLKSILGAYSGNTIIGLNGWDTSFNSTEIRVSNVSATVTFRFEVKLCVEYMVLPSSPVYSITKHPVKADLPVIEAVQLKSSQLQPAMDQGTIISNPVVEYPITTNDLNKIANDIKKNIPKSKPVQKKTIPMQRGKIVATKPRPK